METTMKDRLLKYAFIASLSLNAVFGIEHAVAYTAVKTGAVEGYVKSSITVGNPQQAMIAQLPADQVLPASFVMPATEKKTTQWTACADPDGPLECDSKKRIASSKLIPPNGKPFNIADKTHEGTYRPGDEPKPGRNPFYKAQ